MGKETYKRSHDIRHSRLYILYPPPKDDHKPSFMATIPVLPFASSGTDWAGVGRDGTEWHLLAQESKGKEKDNTLKSRNG